MAKTVRFVGDICLFLTGLVAGILLSIMGTASLVTADSKVDELNAIFLFPTLYYVIGIVVMAGLAYLLRQAARRLA